MNQDVALWAIGILLAVVGFLLVRVLKQGDDTNQKVTVLGVTVAEIKEWKAGIENRVNSLHDWRTKQQDRDLDNANAEIRRLEDERRLGPPDRRGAS